MRPFVTRYWCQDVTFIFLVRNTNWGWTTEW